MLNQSSKTILHEELRQQIQAQILPAYLYTYPPKSSYRPFKDWQTAVGQWQKISGDITLYIHVPFCDMKCHFCDLFTVTKLHTDSVMLRLLNCLRAELEMMACYIQKNSVQVSSIYFGGGTPTLLPAESLHLILTTIQKNFILKENIEFSIEGAPNSLHEKKLKELKSLGFNRISIGIQSFQQSELRAMGRHYDANLGFDMAYLANQVLHFENTNIDLIYGIPNQTLDAWQFNIEKAVALNPQTITLYPLMLRKRTFFGKQSVGNCNKNFTAEQERYDWYDRTVQWLTSVGYQQKTFVNFAKKSGGCRYEENSFLGSPTLSVGPGSRKYATALHYTDDNYIERQSNKTTFLHYMEKIEQGVLPIQSAVFLSKSEQMLRFFILGLLFSGVHKKQFRERFGTSLSQCYGNVLAILNTEGLIEDGMTNIHLTAKGYKYSSIIGGFLSSPEVKASLHHYQ